MRERERKGNKGIKKSYGRRNEVIAGTENHAFSLRFQQRMQILSHRRATIVYMFDIYRQHLTTTAFYFVCVFSK